MNRNDMFQRMQSEDFDVLVVGGGATGLGVAVDAASRGYTTALLESEDFAKATSSRSTKLVHGGVRYLEQLDIALVTEALRERGIFYQNAPHIVRDLPFIVPRYKWWEGPFYGAGLKAYDMLAGKLNIAKSKFLSVEETVKEIPNVEQKGLRGGIRYHDGQFDDARMAIALALTAADHGAVVLNQCEVMALEKNDGYITGVKAHDKVTDSEFTINAKVVVNACGIFADSIRKMDEEACDPVVEPAQGVHLVWHHRILVGTTDTPMPKASLEPRALNDEIEFILRNASRFLARDPNRSDIKAVFAGQRPLVHPGGTTKSDSKSISRNHEVFLSAAGLVTIVGGKWTTYRKMAEDTLKQVIAVGQLEEKPCITESLRVHGAMDRNDPALPSTDPHRMYGSDAKTIEDLAKEEPSLAEKLHDDLPYTGAEILWAAREEMAMTVEDALARRTRSLLLDAEASIEAAPRVAKIMAEELGHGNSWCKDQIAEYTELARGYTIDSFE
jgi:glycerol-3-phosphate dehydrogenase